MGAGRPPGKTGDLGGETIFGEFGDSQSYVVDFIVTRGTCISCQDGLEAGLPQVGLCAYSRSGTPVSNVQPWERGGSRM